MKNKKIRYLTEEELADFSKFVLLLNKLKKVKYQKVMRKYYNLSKSDLAFLLALKWIEDNDPKGLLELKRAWLGVEL